MEALANIDSGRDSEIFIEPRVRLLNETHVASERLCTSDDFLAEWYDVANHDQSPSDKTDGEISPSRFQVEGSVTAKAEEIWRHKGFLPEDVRAEPHKIIMMGPNQIEPFRHRQTVTAPTDSVGVICIWMGGNRELSFYKPGSRGFFRPSRIGQSVVATSQTDIDIVALREHWLRPEQKNYADQYSAVLVLVFRPRDSYDAKLDSMLAQLPVPFGLLLPWYCKDDDKCDTRIKMVKEAVERIHHRKHDINCFPVLVRLTGGASHAYSSVHPLDFWNLKQLNDRYKEGNGRTDGRRPLSRDQIEASVESRKEHVRRYTPLKRVADILVGPDTDRLDQDFQTRAPEWLKSLNKLNRSLRFYSTQPQGGQTWSESAEIQNGGRLSAFYGLVVSHKDDLEGMVDRRATLRKRKERID
ncbi:unnamed protein product [Sympodiomycopsis kandeliae]